jgi:hypothetical protein
MRVTPSWWLTKWFGEDDGDLVDTDSNRRVATVYLLLVTLMLVVLLWLDPSGTFWKTIFVILSGWRLLEIVIVGLSVVLGREDRVIGFRLVTVGIWAANVALVFAILGHSIATNGFVAQGNETASAPFDYLYISWSQMLTVGSSYSAATTNARVLSLGASTSGAFLLAVFVASALSHERTARKTTALCTAPVAGPLRKPATRTT